MRGLAILAGGLVLWAAQATAADLSPGRWPAAERARLERGEQVPFPTAVRTLEGRELVSATLSALAAHVGLEVLVQGGTAADAAVATALTQVATDLGAVVSYAGVAELIYFEARTGRTHVMDAGWTGYAGEREPHTLPAPDIAAILAGRTTGGGVAEGRKTLVPGFMAVSRPWSTRSIPGCSAIPASWCRACPSVAQRASIAIGWRRREPAGGSPVTWRR